MLRWIMDEFIPALLGEKDLKSAWIKKPLQMIFILLGLIFSFFITIILVALLYGLFDLSFQKYGEILFLGRARSFLSDEVLYFIVLAFVIITELIILGIIGSIVEKRKRKLSYAEQEQTAEKEEKLNSKEKLIVAMISVVVILIIFALGYYGSYNRVSVFTENKIYYGTFYQPILKEYSYADIENAELDYEDSHIQIDFFMNNGDRIKFRSSGQDYSYKEKYSEDYKFIADLVLRLNKENIPIEYSSTYEDVAVYCGEEHHDNLKIIFNE